MNDAAREEKPFELPLHLRSETRRWISLLVLVVVSAFAGGPVASWPTLEPLLIKEGVFAGSEQLVNLSSVFSIAMGLGLVCVVFAGMLYDAVGPRALASCSAFLIAVTLFGMAVSIQFPSLNKLLWVAYPLTSVLGNANCLGAYAWMVLLPHHASTVGGIVGAIQILSDTLVLLAVFLHNEYGLRVSVYLLIMACLSVVAGCVSLALIPSFELLRRCAKEIQRENVAPQSGNFSNYGTTGTYQNDTDLSEAESVWDTFRKLTVAFMNSLVVLFRVHPMAFVLQLMATICIFMFGAFPQVVMYPLYTSLFGRNEVTTLVDIYGGLGPCAAAISLIMVGRLCDYAGFVNLFALVIPLVIIAMLLFCVPSMVAQVLAQVLISVVQTPSAAVLVPRWCLSYMPPELFGSGFGIFTGILGIAEMLGIPIGTQIGIWLASCIGVVVNDGDRSTAFVILITIAMWSVLATVCSFMYILYLRIHPMPLPGSTTMDIVQNVFENDLDASLENGLEHKSLRK